ncbi:hypothetical protein OAN18_04385 [Nitrosopumilus sp.]|nr:hypothetical protein [Nitrosopumilus sp.]
MEFIKAKYFAFFFMLVLLTSGFPLNANNDGDILPTADAQRTDNGNKIFFCENNPINKTEYDKPHMKPQDYMSKCKERTDGYSWGSRIYVLLWAPGFNADDKKIDTLGNDGDGQGLITLSSRDGSVRADSKSSCNSFIETGRDHGLFYGSIKLRGFSTTVNDDNVRMYGGDRCEGSGNYNGMGTLDDGVLGVKTGQDGGVTMSFEYGENKWMHKSATHTWRIADFNFDKEEYTMDDTAVVTIKDLDGLRYPFDKRTGYQMHIWSDTDQGGVEVNAYWKPNFRGTAQMHGDYPVKITFIDPDRRESTVRELYYKSGGSQVELKVSPGDNIYAEYYDRTLPKPYSTEDKLKLNAIATITEGPNTGVIVVNPPVIQNDDLHAKQFAFTKYTSNGEYLVSVWWDSWDWWTNQPTANSDNSINISIVEGLTEKPVSDVTYSLNVSSSGDSVLDKDLVHVRTDIIDVPIDNTNLIEVVLSDIGEAADSLKFKFKIDGELQPNAPFTKISQ